MQITEIKENKKQYLELFRPFFLMLNAALCVIQ